MVKRRFYVIVGFERKIFMIQIVSWLWISAANSEFHQYRKNFRTVRSYLAKSQDIQIYFVYSSTYKIVTQKEIRNQGNHICRRDL